MKKQSSTQFNSKHNRDKLIQQNVKLYKQIKILQEKMSRVITLDVSRAVQVDNKKSQINVVMKQYTLQQNYIRKLKNKIKQLKALNLTDISMGIINEQNQLVALKKQFEKLAQEKRLRGKKCLQRKSALQYNNPLSQFKNETQTELQRIRKKNADMSAKIVELQRQVRKYHKYQQMHKKLKDQKIVIENPQFQYAKIDHQKANLLKKSKLIEQKWKPQLQALDNQYFQNKQILIRKQKIVNDLQKQLKNWQNRSLAVRNQSDVILDRQRLAKVITASPVKKQNVEKNKNIQKSVQKKQETGIADFFKNLFTKNNQKMPQKLVKSNLNNSKQLIKQQKPDRIWNNLAAQTRYGTQSQKVKQNNQGKLDFTRLSQKNQFMNSKHSFQGFDLKNLKPKPENQKVQIKQNKILTNSIAVGTSFYYNEED